MRKILLACLSLVLSATLSAAPSGKSSVMPFQDVVILGCDNAGIYAVTASSSVATSARPANTERNGIVIRNNYTDTVYLSTWAATSSSGLYPIAASAEFADDSAPYTGAWYVLAPPTISSATVTVIEKW